MDTGTDTGSNSQSSTTGAVNSEQSASQNHRQKSDIAWKYCSVGVNSQGRRTLTCGYCFKVIAGGGIHRMKQHLAGEQGSIVPCSKGISFIKSVDAYDIVTSAENLCNLFAEIVEMVGSNNVVHLVTDNASNYKVAGSLLSERYPNICWSPCTAHCINLILKDIGEMNDVKAIVSLVSTVTVFIYNHKFTLNWLRKTTGWKEIIRPGETRFATTFIALKSLHDHKDSLQSLVTSGDYKQFLRIEKGKDVKQIVLDERFWNNCLIMVRIMGPIIRLLRICDTDERPSLGYLYEGMFRAINGIKRLFRNKERLYKPYIDIISDRWDRMLRKNLHAAAYYLNPAFQYESATFCTHPEVINGLLDYIETKVDWCNPEKLSQEIGMYRERQWSFGRKLAILTSKSDRPGYLYIF
ncbi:uncharacterized protein [Coffea arabica]|uniref:DUF659 domain-containing protein n=1 Tax=Coffea arabica TaxID=13443 RepID=A0ABM4V358_COFAR